MWDAGTETSQYRHHYEKEGLWMRSVGDNMEDGAESIRATQIWGPVLLRNRRRDQPALDLISPIQLMRLERYERNHETNLLWRSRLEKTIMIEKGWVETYLDMRE